MATPSPKYLQVDRATFEGVMDTIRTGLASRGAGGSVEQRVFGREIVYDVRLPPHPARPDVAVSVFSSISVSNAQARDVGDDAVRIVVTAKVIDPRNGQSADRPVRKSVRLYRTAPTGIPHEQRLAAFAERLTNAIRDAYKRARHVTRCRECGTGVMLYRTTKSTPKRAFFGCSNYPQCRATAPSLD